jgi:hypothetical protein
MKFKIIFGAVMISMMVAMVSSVNITVDNISENKAGLTRLNKSFLSLSEEFESVNRNADLIQSTRESYRNSLVELSDRVSLMEETNSEIYRILNDLDERLNAEPIVEPEIVEPEPVEELGVNAGLGVLTGTQVLGQPEILPEPEPEPELMTCPKVKSVKPYSDYIENITIKRTLKFTVIYDLFEGNVVNVQYDGKLPNKVKQATLNYVMDLEFDNPVTMTGCTLPFTINI